MKTQIDEDIYLEHYGVLGMRWGRRVARAASGNLAKDVASLKKHGYTKEAKGVEAELKKQQQKFKDLDSKIKEYEANKRGGKEHQRAKAIWKKDFDKMTDDEFNEATQRFVAENTAKARLRKTGDKRAEKVKVLSNKQLDSINHDPVMDKKLSRINDAQKKRTATVVKAVLVGTALGALPMVLIYGNALKETKQELREAKNS